MDKVLLIGRDDVPQKIVLGEGESLVLTLVVLPGVSCDLPLEIDLDGPGAKVDLAGIYVCRSDENVRIRVNVRHNAPSCESQQTFRGLSGGTSRAEFDGLIYVGRDSQKTKAFQQCHTILLSQDACCNSQPQLEIYADDVECSHGATSGYLDDTARFYMQSRGIPEDEARSLQMISFFSDVASRLPDDIKEMVYDSLA